MSGSRTGRKILRPYVRSHASPLSIAINRVFFTRQIVSECSVLLYIRPMFRSPPATRGYRGLGLMHDSAEKPLGMLRRAQHERKNLNLINSISVRPELCRRVNAVFLQNLSGTMTPLPVILKIGGPSKLGPVKIVQVVRHSSP